MTRKSRRILLVSIILFFVFTAPAVLFYAWGYSFDWSKKKPVLTGGLSLRSIPKKADIYLNDKLINQTPAFIKRILPGEYQIKISKQGYHEWQKKLRVESKIVTQADNIILIPLRPQLEIVEEGFIPEEETNHNEEIALLDINQENIQGFQFTNDHKKLLYFTSWEIWVYYLENGQKELITRLSQEIKQAIWYGKTNEHIIFLVGQDIKIIELDDRDQRNIFDIVNLEASQISYNQNDEKIYLVQEDKLLRISLE